MRVPFRVAWLAITFTGAVLCAQEQIFIDGFEDGSTCFAWSDTVSRDPCDGVDNDCDLNLDEDSACDDNIACTFDYCGGVLGCQSSINSDACLIYGVCYPHGQTWSLGVCRVCNSVASQTMWSDNDGVECDDGEDCTTDDRCLGGVCTGDPILDQFEPNDSMAAAVDQGSIDDSDAYPFDSFNATLYPSADYDWFRYHVNDTPDGDVRPRVQLAVPSGVNYTLCAYFDFDCDEPYIGDVDCLDGTYTSHSGFYGCCSSLSGSSNENVHFEADCGDWLNHYDSGTVYIRISRVGTGTSCSNYTVQWGDD